MVATDLISPAASRPVPTHLFHSLAFHPNAYNEAFSSLNSPREHWQALVAEMQTTGSDLLRERQNRVKRMRHEDGAAFNPFDDATGQRTPWSLDVIPLPLTTVEWAGLEAGLTQRALLLEKILADTYGPQDLLKGGQIPAALVFANPKFLRPCHGIHPPRNRFLTFYAADLYRGVDGRFRVLGDYGANPPGLGYALENRIILSRVLSELFHQTQIRRLAPFFQTFQRNLIERASRHREDPGIVLMSPGPESPIYFEHALLSRYLGYPLVEGQDLTVRNGKVFLKKLAGLEPVEGIFRHTVDESNDPFVLRGEATNGVAGLIQVARDRNIDIVNPIGSGFIETSALTVFLPSLCRRLMGEDLLLENHPAWWCGNTRGMEYVAANLDHLVVASAFERSAKPLSRSPGLETIQAAPYAFMAREPVYPAEVPAWDRGGITSHYALMRVFACATDQGFAFMPGGLAITAGDVNTLWGDCPDRQQSKDIWVLSDQPVEPFSLMGGLQSVTEFRRGSDLPSRVADHLLWLGRYLERAEGLIRLLRSVFRKLTGEARLEEIPELPFLLKLLRAENRIPQAPADDGSIPPYRCLSAYLNDALYQKERPQSVLVLLKQVQGAARNVRDRLSIDSWRVINRLEAFAHAPVGDPLDLLDDTLFTLSAFSGLAMESMTRGLGWRFLDMGRRVERAMNQAGLIRLALPEICMDSRSALETLLEVSDSIMTYRARYRTAFQLAPVLDLLLVDESNPKALAFQISQIVAHVAHLPRQSDEPLTSQEERMAREMLHAVRQMDLTVLRCFEGDAQIESLAVFLESIETRLKEFAQQISAHFLSRVPATPHFSMIFGDQRS